MTRAPVHPYDTDGRGGQLVWLASYPKSGNTWVRALLAAYGHDNPDEFALTDLRLGANVLSRSWLAGRWGIPTSYLTSEQIQRRLPATLTEHAVGLRRLQFLKTHNAWLTADEKTSIFAGCYTRRAVVIVRNPLAVVPSMAHHMDRSIDQTIADLTNPDFALATTWWRSATQVPQYLGDWDSHVTGWLEQDDVAVTLLRYEDLRLDPASALRRLLTDCGVIVEPGRIVRAVAATEFARLQSLEAEAGFVEAMSARRFFRSGKADSWREELSPAQIEAVVETHAGVMARLGYRPTS